MQGEAVDPAAELAGREIGPRGLSEQGIQPGQRGYE
jgi:hypothetical protein